MGAPARWAPRAGDTALGVPARPRGWRLLHRVPLSWDCCGGWGPSRARVGGGVGSGLGSTQGVPRGSGPSLWVSTWPLAHCHSFSSNPSCQRGPHWAAVPAGGKHLVDRPGTPARPLALPPSCGFGLCDAHLQSLNSRCLLKPHPRCSAGGGGRLAYPASCPPVAGRWPLPGAQAWLGAHSPPRRQPAGLGARWGGAMAPGGGFCLQPKDRGTQPEPLPQKGPAAGVQTGGCSLTSRAGRARSATGRDSPSGG